MNKFLFVRILLISSLVLGCTVESIELFDDKSLENKPIKVHILLDLSGRIFMQKDTAHVNDAEIIGKIFFNLLNDERGYNIGEDDLIKVENYYYPRFDPYAGSTPYTSVGEVVVAPLNFSGEYFLIKTPNGQSRYQYLNSKSDTLRESLCKDYKGVIHYLEKLYAHEKSKSGLNIWSELGEYLSKLDTIHEHRIILFTDGFVNYHQSNVNSKEKLWTESIVNDIKNNSDKFDEHKRELSYNGKKVITDFMFVETGGYDHVEGVLFSDGNDQNSVLKKLWQNYLVNFDKNISWYMKWRDPKDDDIKAFLFESDHSL